jgi:hypothetical protein
MTNDPICACQNCDWNGPRSALNPDIPHYHERVAPGEVEPDGECPLCGALAHKTSPHQRRLPCATESGQYGTASR